MGDITVCTGAIPERLPLLAECCTSFYVQTLPPAAHLIGVDYDHAGPTVTYNRLVAAADTDYVTLMADDDLADPNHLQLLWENRDLADVVWTWCRTRGPHTFTRYNVDRFEPEMLHRDSVVAGPALFRRDLWMELGGWDETWGCDWRFWQKALAAGATFGVVPTVTWTYRFTEYGNLSKTDRVCAGHWPWPHRVKA